MGELLFVARRKDVGLSGEGGPGNLGQYIGQVVNRNTGIYHGESLSFFLGDIQDKVRGKKTWRVANSKD